jgi:hypothetical protein
LQVFTVFSLKKSVKTTIIGHPLAVCKVKNLLSVDFLRFLCAKRNKLLGGGFYRIKETLHPGLFTGGAVLFDDPLSRGGIELLDHILKRRFRFYEFFFPGQRDELFNAGSDRAFHRFIPKPAIFAPTVTLFSGTAPDCQKKTSIGRAPGGRLPE